MIRETMATEPIPDITRASEGPDAGSGLAPRLRLLDHLPAEATAQLREVLVELGEPGWRAKQVVRQAFVRRVRSFAAMTDLPVGLRERLEARVQLPLLSLVHRAQSGDGTVKYLWSVEGGGEIESVAIPSEGRISFCISSQVGCALHCRFCATGALGLARNLRQGEMVDQVVAMLADMAQEPPRLSVVFMGMGEPGYNMDAVVGACRALNDADGLGIGARHLTISTSGVVPAIERLAKESLQVRLAVSLHSGHQARREALMDVATRHPLPELLASCQVYHVATGRNITFEYAVMRGVNDSAEDARLLAEFAAQVPSKINLIPYNPVEGFEAPASTERDAARFRLELERHFTGDVMVRQTRGRDIEAACGMLHRARKDAAVRPAAAT